MAKKKQVTKVVDELPKAYRGSFSTFMVTMIIIGLCFFLPMITANEVEKSRSGEGRYTPMEEMIWDLKDEEDFYPIKYTEDENELGDALPDDTSPYDEAGESHSVYWRYHAEVISEFNGNSITSQVENIVDFEIPDPVIDEYGSLTLIASGEIEEVPLLHDLSFESEYNAEQLILILDQDSADWIDKDATRVDIYINFETSDIPNPLLTVEWVTKSNGGEYTIASEDDWVNGDIYSVDVSVEDLIAISSIRGSGEYIRITLSSEDNEGYPPMDDGDLIIYDVQVYGLDSTTASLTIISAWYIVQSVIIFLMGIVMLPQISIGGMVEYLTNFTKSF